MIDNLQAPPQISDQLQEDAFGGRAILSRMAALALLGLIIFILWSVVMAPLVENTLTRHQRITRLETELQHASHLYNREKGLQSELVALKRALPGQQLATSSPAGPQSQRRPSLTALVQPLIVTPGITIKQFAPNEQAREVKLVLIANIKELSTLLFKLENQTTPLIIDELTIVKNKPEDIMLGIHMTIRPLEKGAT